MDDIERPQPDLRELRRECGLWLLGLRHKAQLSQAELAKRVGVEVYTFIAQLEGGRGRIPSDRYESWAKALNVPAAEFAWRALSYYDRATYDLLSATHRARAPVRITFAA